MDEVGLCSTSLPLRSRKRKICGTPSLRSVAFYPSRIILGDARYLEKDKKALS